MQSASDNRCQALQPTLEDVISCACFQTFDRDFLADVSGNKDERKVQSALQKKLERGESIEIGQAVIGEYDFKIGEGERLDEGLPPVHAAPGAVVSARLERSDIQFGIDRVIVEQQYA